MRTSAYALTFVLVLTVFRLIALAAISISTTTPYTQNFDSIGTSATATLPADFRVDKTGSGAAAVRALGTFGAAGTTTGFAGGANLSSSATNGIYNFGSGTTSGGGSDRAIGFVASSGGTASGNLYAQFQNTTGGPLSGLQISYDVEKYRGGSNPQGFCIQLYSSPDGSTWTTAGATFLTKFAADASNAGYPSAPGATTSITNTALTLPANVPANGSVYLAWNYSVCSGTTVTNAQALAIDNISVLGIASTASTNPTATTAANPPSVVVGGSTLLTVTVTPGANPASTGLAVSADLSSIGGSSSQQFFDDGTNGDQVAGNNVFSYSATVSEGSATGIKSLPVAITDDQSRSGSAISTSLSRAPRCRLRERAPQAPRAFRLAAAQL
ncbi:MAG: hypothetical protein ACRD1V_04355 [Vicinamibacterales bacterium]